MRFSEHFNLGATQVQLDFVDIPIETDVSLFIDPYALSLEDDPWFVGCHELLLSYFQLVLDHIRDGGERQALELLEQLREPNDTHLGYSRARPAGRGIGSLQARALYNSLADSEAVRTGFIQDLSDCELLISGIGRDKVSDITINVIKQPLFEYTARQCALHGIPVRTVASGRFWDSSKNRWSQASVDLPIVGNTRIVLVPKAAVRYESAVTPQRYYNDYILEYFQAEHIEAGTSLVKTLTTGPRVYKKDLMPLYPYSKGFLYSFSKDHPGVLNEYRDALLHQAACYLTDQQIENRQDVPNDVDYASLTAQLSQIPLGLSAASQYHEFATRAVVAAFYPRLYNVVKEQEVNEGRKRIDLVLNATASPGFFRDLREVHRVKCPYILVECKNFTEDPSNPELDQLLGRFSDHRGSFGILLCRNVKDKPLMLKRCKDVLNDQKRYILVLDDQDLTRILGLKAEGKERAVDEYLAELFRQLVF